jgi:hypothetical protein
MLAAAALALLLDRLWPDAPKARLALAASLILPVGLGLLFAAMYLDAQGQRPNPDRIDDLFPALALLIGPILVTFTWAFGFAAAFEILDRRRRMREP